MLSVCKNPADYQELEGKVHRGYVEAILHTSHSEKAGLPHTNVRLVIGLALLFFLLSLTGNLTYGASLFAYSQKGSYLLKALPWLLGSLGTIVEDSIIFVQFKLYSAKPQAKANGLEPSDEYPVAIEA